ncbi:SDR family oxidoreductase [Vagococcus fluvialis]|uniref:SDR family oxidoreductase n=1 Tax=Vagococcus fluvialis TaxID=2738 RepID=UPI003D130CDF
MENKMEFDKDSVFLVTGGAGFIGSNLCEKLVNEGYKVKCLDNLSNGFYSNIEKLLSFNNFTFIEGDILDYELCEKVTQNVTYVLHQAAWGSVPRSIKMPLKYEEINIKGTLNMMEASKVNKVKKFVYASSSSVYGDSPFLPKREGIEGSVLSPYALTKSVNEQYGKLYSSLYGLETVGLRYFNVFGRQQNPNGDYAAVIPKFITKLLKKEDVIINGDGEQSRDFTYIENVIEANLRAAISGKESSGKSFNIACGDQITLNELFSTLTKELNLEDAKAIYGEDRVGDIKHSNADITEASKFLNYNPEYNFEKGIKEAITWYRDNLDI